MKTTTIHASFSLAVVLAGTSIACGPLDEDVAEEDITETSGALVPSADLNLYRAWNGTTIDSIVDHLLTNSDFEYNSIRGVGRWHQAGIIGRNWSSAADGRQPLYRVYSSYATDHLYTCDPAERQNAISNLGFRSETTAGNVYTYNRYPGELCRVYRLYNSAQRAHVYTTSTAEVNRSNGYHRETAGDFWVQRTAGCAN